LRQNKEKIEVKHHGSRPYSLLVLNLGGIMGRERRRSPRYFFFASAELLEPQSDVRIASRVSELSRNGCYLDMMNPFPVNTVVLLKIWKEESNILHTKGCVVYSQPNQGAGVAFVDMEPKYLQVLEQWLEQAKKDS
jgi:hypothetical protein